MTLPIYEPFIVPALSSYQGIITTLKFPKNIYFRGTVIYAV